MNINKTYSSIIAVSALLVLVPTTAVAFGQLSQSQSPLTQQLFPGATPLPPNVKVPPIPPGGLHPPAAVQAQITADFAHAQAILDQIDKQMIAEHNTSSQNFLAHLKALSAQGIIDCAHPGDPALLHHCILAPPTANSVVK